MLISVQTLRTLGYKVRKKQKKRKGITKSPTNNSPIQQFRRALHSKPTLRRGLAIARTQTKPEHFPAIVNQLGRHQVYRTAIVATGFPADLASYTSKRRLQRISAEGELMWAASVLALFGDELKEYVGLRDSFHRAYLNGSYEQAREFLDQIQSQFGYSLWLLGYRIQLLQLADGLTAQKDLLEEVVSTDGLSQIVAWFTYYLSLRAGNNVSFAKVEDEASEVLELEELGAHFLSHLLPYDLTRIDDPSVVLAWDEPHSIIDRFESFVSMAMLYCAKFGQSNGSSIISALQLLEETKDIRILRTLAVLCQRFDTQVGGVVSFADDYTEGNYRAVIEGESDSLELVARSWALLGEVPPHGDQSSIRDQIIRLMFDVLVMSSEAQQSRLRLKKVALFCAGHTFATQIVGFLERKHDHVFVNEYNELDRFVALNSPLDNPWSASVIDDICHGDWLQKLVSEHPGSSSLRLRNWLKLREVPSSEYMGVLPEYRRNLYAGHIAINSKDYATAVACYKAGAGSTITYISSMARRYLFDAYYEQHNYEAAMRLVVDHLLSNPSAAFAYPLGQLSQSCLESPELRKDINLAILLHMAARNGNPSLERDLSDIYENVMDFSGLTRPSLLSENLFDQKRLIYFLRFICVPRTLEDTTCFEGVDEIDTERIAICQRLLQLDPQNESSYLAEIRSTIRDNKVAHLLTQMQTSKIYVDEAGIRHALEPMLRDAFARYQQLLKSPNLAYQAEKLSKRLGELLSSKGHPEFKDLKLPATEREGLFGTMLIDTVSEFALNPAYGLDTHVSTSIRHGAFEGHLRSPMAVEDLLCASNDGEYAFPNTWSKRLVDLSKKELDLIQKHLVKFTQKIEDLIAIYLNEKLHIRVAGNTTAMFSFEAEGDKTLALIDSITESTDFDTFVDRLMLHCWSLTIQSLAAIQRDLMDVMAHQVNQAFDGLVRGLDATVPHNQIVPLVDAIARARTSFQSAIDDVIEWFQKPTDLSRDPFDFDVAVHVALQQVANCYVRTPLEPVMQISIPQKLDGTLLDGMCEVLFILLQNVILHGGRGEQPVSVSLSASVNDDVLTVECRNTLSDSVSLCERRHLAAEAMNRYERDSALRMARKEGGSGLSKVWRIAEFDFRKQHSLELDVMDTREFVARLKFIGLVSC